MKKAKKFWVVVEVESALGNGELKKKVEKAILDSGVKAGDISITEIKTK